MSDLKRRHRCAIYTRKSTEEGLEQEFNTLDAQRASCEAYVLSQAGEGWNAISTLYDDGGWSGGNMDRPAIKRLLEDIDRGRVDIVVVYKVDRLTRSLMDFARIVERFDARDISFVSVTQAFNTTSSMGRLTLNVLLSFAQFEREVTGERIRDKIAASKARGMWMGGNIPLGYDLDNRKLVPNAIEAATVKHIFETYLRLGSIVRLADELDLQGVRSKSWTSRRGRDLGGVTMTCGAIAHILKNRIYRGDIVHKGKRYDGEHEAIVSQSLFDRVQKAMARNRVTRRAKKTRAASCPLIGKLFDDSDRPMRPSFGYGRGSKIYRYYVSDTLLPEARGSRNGAGNGMRVSAERLERFLADRLAPLRGEDETECVMDLIERANFAGDRLNVTLNLVGARVRENTSNVERLIVGIDPAAKIEGDQAQLSFDIHSIKRGRSVRAPHAAVDHKEQETIVVGLVRAAHAKLLELHASPLDIDNHRSMKVPVNEWTRERLAVGLLAPDIQKRLLKGDLPANFDPAVLVSGDLPMEWDAQRRLLGFVAN